MIILDTGHLCLKWAQNYLFYYPFVFLIIHSQNPSQHQSSKALILYPFSLFLFLQNHYLHGSDLRWYKHIAAFCSSPYGYYSILVSWLLVPLQLIAAFLHDFNTFIANLGLFTLSVIISLVLFIFNHSGIFSLLYFHREYVIKSFLLCCCWSKWH